jgi:hypothetical protein
MVYARTHTAIERSPRHVSPRAPAVVGVSVSKRKEGLVCIVCVCAWVCTHLHQQTTDADGTRARKGSVVDARELEGKCVCVRCVHDVGVCEYACALIHCVLYTHTHTHARAVDSKRRIPRAAVDDVVPAREVGGGGQVCCAYTHTHTHTHTTRAGYATHHKVADIDATIFALVYNRFVCPLWVCVRYRCQCSTCAVYVCTLTVCVCALWHVCV